MLPATTLTSTTHGVVDLALGQGRLLRSRPARELDRLELVLSHGQVDPLSAISIGGGANGTRHRMLVEDPSAPGTSLWAVRRPVEAEAAQDAYAWKLGREVGMDHLMPAVARREDGAAWVEFMRGGTLHEGGITSVQSLDEALERSYAADARLRLTPSDAALAARTDRQLLQVLDYLLANSDRHLGNGLYDARTGALAFIDFGHMGRGTAMQGASRLEPGLRQFQAGTAGEVVLDAHVLDYLRARLTPDRIRALHEETFHAPDIATPKPDPTAAPRSVQVQGAAFREDIVARFEHVLDTGSYRHVAADEDLAAGRDPGALLQRAVGLNAVRRAFMEFDGF